MRVATWILAAGVAAGCTLSGCSTLLGLLETAPAPGEPVANLLHNPSFESFKGRVGEPYPHLDGKVSTRGVATGWVVNPGTQAVVTSIAPLARVGRFSQRVDVQAPAADRQRSWVGLGQPQRRLRLRGDTQYELAAWVKGRGVASLSVVLNDAESRTLGSKVVLTDEWQLLQMAFATPRRVRNVGELIRFGEDERLAGSGGVAEGDWLLVDGVTLHVARSRLASLSPEAIASIAERRAAGPDPGARVVAAALALVRSGTVVKGGCWDWVNRAYTDAGVPAKKRRTVFQSRPEGPYVNCALIRPGDWISFLNLTYGEIGHSAIFVDWIDLERHSALTMEYAGENREVPGRFREYDIFKCYGVSRPAE